MKRLGVVLLVVLICLLGTKRMASARNALRVEGSTAVMSVQPMLFFRDGMLIDNILKWDYDSAKNQVVTATPAEVISVRRARPYNICLVVLLAVMNIAMIIGIILAPNNKNKR